jgi:DNA uptake protein ComE-like DNA-binding protein
MERDGENRQAMTDLRQSPPTAPTFDNEGLLARRRLFAALAVLTLTFGMCAAATLHYARRITWPIQAATVNSQRVQTGIDPNTAEWFKLAQLPRIGETVAKRIVAEREAHSSEIGHDRPVFRKPSDLTRVRGIGDKTILRLAPFLRFSDTDGGR